MSAGPQEVCTLSAPPPLQPLSGPQHIINLNKLKHMSGMNQFKRIQPYPTESNESILKVRLKQGTSTVDGKMPQDNQIEITENEEKREVENTSCVSASLQTPESQQEFININITGRKDYINEFPQLITIHGLTTEKKLAMEQEKDLTEDNSAVKMDNLVDDLLEPIFSSFGEAPLLETPNDELNSTNNKKDITNNENDDTCNVENEEKGIAETKTKTESGTSGSIPDSNENTSEKTDNDTTEKENETTEVLGKKEDSQGDKSDAESQPEQKSNEELGAKKLPRQFKRPSILGFRKKSIEIKKSIPPGTSLLISKSAKPGSVKVSKNSNKATKISRKSSDESASSASVVETKHEENKSEPLQPPEIDEKSMKPVSKDFDPVKLLDWQDGVGVLPGSDLKVKFI
jgi:hypothetical protein